MEPASSPDHIDIAIVGAGAAGLAAGVFAGEAKQGTELSVVLLEGAKALGAKILVSGGGRCNVTHEVVTPADFFGNRHIIKNVLAAFPVERTIQWFASLGVELKREETGKLFPVTNQARTVLHALTHRCRALDVEIRTGRRVTAIDPCLGDEGGFLLHHPHGTVRARRVVVATGGRSLPRSGSDGTGYRLVQRLGHQVTPTAPALVPLVLAETFLHRELSGLSQQVGLATKVDGKTVDRRTGSLLWTHVGISGPVVMDASRFWTLAHLHKDPIELLANFLPGSTADQVRSWLLQEAAAHPRRSLRKTMALRVPERFAEALCRQLAVDAEQPMAQVPRADRDRVCGALTHLPLPVERDRGWNVAEVTAGGVPLEEINFRTMESRLVPGLYLIGELLDCDGRIGGFNFQWAWATGRLGGHAAVISLRSGRSEADSRSSGPPR